MKKLVFILLLALFCVAGFGQTKVACVGNSVTYGAGIQNREVDGYPAVLGRLLGKNFEVKNFGRNGATLLAKGHNPYIKTEQYTDAIAFKPDVVIIHLGLNDTDPRNWPQFQDEFRSDYAALINDFRVANPKVRVIVARMSPISHRHSRFKTGTREWYRQIQTAIEQVADANKVELIDFQEVLYPRPNLLPDSIHPNEQGAAMLAQRAYAAITGDFGGLQLSPLYSDNMVLQKGGKVVGTADAGQKIKVSIAGRNVTTTADQNGHWTAPLPYDKYAQGLTLTINEKSFANVAIGEVWLLSGQSNMSWSVGWGVSTPENVRPNDNIYLFRCEPTFETPDSLSAAKLQELNDLKYINCAGWQTADKEQIKAFSAVGYFFGQMLADSLPNVAIGLIQTSLGGANAEAFIDRQSLEDNPALTDILYNPRGNEMIMEWCRSVMNKNLSGAKDPLQRHYFEPAYLWEARIEPLTDYSIQGVLWYQGESNADYIELHEELFPTLVQGWRKGFAQPDLPFYFVQLTSHNRPSWPEFRDSQRRMVEKIANCEMVVTHPWGDSLDVHPRAKQPVGEMLAKIALTRNYGFGIPYQAPTVTQIQSKANGDVVLTLSESMTTNNGQAPITLEVGDKNMIFTPATECIIEGAQTIIKSGVVEPRYVRYGWQPFTHANMVGAKSGLPLSTFKMKIRN